MKKMKVEIQAHFGTFRRAIAAVSESLVRRSSLSFINVSAVNGAAYLVYAGIMFSVACNFASSDSGT
jgi:hypothetical protein